MNLDWFESHVGTAQWVGAGAAILAVCFATYVGHVQNSINSHLAKLEDSVEVFGYLFYSNSTSTPIGLRVTNVGKLQVYLTGYEINGKEIKIPGSLIPAGQQQNAWYDIPLPIPKELADTDIRIDLDDQLGRHWGSNIKISRVDGQWVTSIKKIVETK